MSAINPAVLAADKNGENCPECTPGTDDPCAYHLGYDDGFLAAMNLLAGDS